jgi:hypothetical protein
LQRAVDLYAMIAAKQKAARSTMPDVERIAVRLN